MKFLFVFPLLLLLTHCNSESCVDSQYVDCNVSESNFKMVKFGMSKSEVFNILGSKNIYSKNPFVGHNGLGSVLPSSHEKQYSNILWKHDMEHWYEKQLNISVTFLNDTVVETSLTGK